jgi:hypothetical protein
MNNSSNNNNSSNVFHTQRQSFIKICERIEKNDSTLSCVELCDEYNLDVRKLAKAIANNTYVTNLNLQKSTFMTTTVITRDTTTDTSTSTSTSTSRIRNRISSWIRSIMHPHNNYNNNNNDSNNNNDTALYYLFMEGLIHNTSIVTLDLSETNLFDNRRQDDVDDDDDDDDSCRPLFEVLYYGLQNQPKIENLLLARCSGLNDNGLQQMNRMILKSTFTSSNINNNAPSSLSCAASWGMRMMKLKSIDISGNNLSNGSTIRQLVMNNAPNLIHLNISNNSFHTKGINKFVCSTTTTTMMNNNGEEGGGFISLKFCDLSSNCIIDEMVDNDEVDNNDSGNDNDNDNDIDNNLSSSLSSLLKLGVALADDCCNLRELRLDNNKLMDCISLAYGLKRNISLEILSLNKNCISDVGVIRLAEALFGRRLNNMNTNTNTCCSTTHLKRLCLSNNRIHNKGAMALVGKSSTLTKIDLSGNCITDCRDILCKVLRDNDSDGSNNDKNITLEQLHLTRNNHIPVNQIHEIGFWMKLNVSGCRHLLTTTCTSTTITTATISKTEKAKGNNNDDKNKTSTKTSPSSSSSGGGGGYFLSVCPIILNKLASIDDPSCLYYFLNRKPEIFSSFFVNSVQRKRKKGT